MHIPTEQPKRIIIRLYRQFDLDILYLFEVLRLEDIEIKSLIKNILHSYVAGNFEPMEKDDVIAVAMKLRHEHPITLRRKMAYILELDEKEDADIIDWVSGITIGFRNTATKAIIRAYMGVPDLYPCRADAQIKFIGKDAQFNRGEVEAYEIDQEGSQNAENDA